MIFARPAISVSLVLLERGCRSGHESCETAYPPFWGAGGNVILPWSIEESPCENQSAPDNQGVEPTEYRGRSVESNVGPAHSGLPIFGDDSLVSLHRVHDGPMTLEERHQADHELSRAYDAALAYEARLQLAGLEEDRRIVRGQREGIARRLLALDSDARIVGENALVESLSRR
jgi:hypothetical protein